jgi:hypothetical protein
VALKDGQIVVARPAEVERGARRGGRTAVFASSAMRDAGVEAEGRQLAACGVPEAGPCI